MKSLLSRALAAAAFAAVGSGCATHSAWDRDKVSQGVEKRSGHPLRPTAEPTSNERPAGVVLTDGLSEDEAVALALWNSPAFGATLTTLGFARADLQEAGFLRNPIFSLLLPLGPKQLESALNWPIDALWQRPRRVAAARLDVERVAQSLVQAGLDVVRDARLAYAEVLLARQRHRLGIESAKVRNEIAGIAESRLAAGDSSEMETNALRIDAARADEESAADLVEAGLAAKEREKEHFFELAEQLARSTSRSGQKRLKAELARLTFGS